MVSKESPRLFVVAGCIFFLFSGTCQAQEGVPLEIESGSSHQQKLLNTAKSVANTVIQAVNATYGLPENDENIKQWSDSKLEALESVSRNRFANRLANKDNFLAIKYNKEKEMKGYVIKDKKVITYAYLYYGKVPAVKVSVFDCKESGHADFASVTIDYPLNPYRGEIRGEWELSYKNSGDLKSIPDKSTPECFRPEIFGNDDESKLNKIEHGDHYHYVPENRNKDVPIGRFPIEPPGPGEYITPSGEIVEKEQ